MRLKLSRTLQKKAWMFRTQHQQLAWQEKRRSMGLTDITPTMPTTFTFMELVLSYRLDFLEMPSQSAYFCYRRYSGVPPPDSFLSLLQSPIARFLSGKCYVGSVILILLQITICPNPWG